MKINTSLVLVAGILASMPGLAQTPEELEVARREAFHAGMEEIVEEFNRGSMDRFIAAIDRDAMVDRIFGLRLIDQKVKRSFRDDLEFRYASLIESGFPAAKEKLRATLLGVESRGDRGRAVVRFDLPDFQFDYHEYELVLDDRNRIVVRDWIDFLDGKRFSDSIGMMLIMAAPGRPAVRKLIDFQNVRDADLFQFTELLKAARDRQLERYIDIIQELDERLQAQKVVVLTTVRLARQIRNRRLLRTALVEVDKHHPDDPLFSLMLLDYYFPARRYEDALAALQRLHERLAVEDAAMEARLSAARLVMEDVEEASAHADAALQLEPDLELAWWSALRARAAGGNFGAAVTALQKLEADFGYDLGPEALDRDPGLKGLLASEEYASWRADR